mmetsp:Transcript_26299/g.60755  ORF Transcript_26299/g.60755 Transcript_26299/m.60755 type:complete len:83 (+) Transcript_26299:69-317(+)
MSLIWLARYIPPDGRIDIRLHANFEEPLAVYRHLRPAAGEGRHFVEIRQPDVQEFWFSLSRRSLLRKRARLDGLGVLRPLEL